MPQLPNPTDLILVVVMNEPRDLEIARLLGWYRIPLRSSPKVVAVDYLAFYQTGQFEQDKWRIRYIAPVRGHELTTRAELLRDELEHPRALQEYFKIQIGSLIELPQPIPAGKWRRITFFYTTGEYLMKAVTVNDLLVHNEEHKTLWRALRDRANQEQQYTSSELPGVDIDPSVLAALLGIDKSTGAY
jgi:hypothetical protein